MTDLTGKFSSFEEQITTQHTELMAALNTIAYALGAPPTTPTVTLEDIGTLLATINTNITSARSADATFYASMFSLTSAINNNTDTIITNNSLNAQRLIAALYATFCACETEVPLLQPPIDVAPTELVDDDKCRRIQFYLALFGSWLSSIANYGSTGAAVTGDVIATLLSAAGAAVGMVVVGAEAGVVGGIPGVVVGAVIGLIVAAVYQFGGTQLVNWAADFNSPVMQDALLEAMYAANSAEEGQAAFVHIVTINFDFIPSSILSALFWNGWANDIYSGVPVVDDSGFDGSICGVPPEEDDCITLNVPTDTGTSAYSYEGNPYGRIQTGALSFFARLQNESTVECAIPLFCSYGGLTYTLPAGTLITWGDLFTAIGGAYPFYMDSAVPSAGFTVEFCNLVPV